MIGFIAGGALNFVHTCMSTLFGRINKVIGLDQIAKYSLELLSMFWNKAIRHHILYLSKGQTHL